MSQTLFQVLGYSGKENRKSFCFRFHSRNGTGYKQTYNLLGLVSAKVQRITESKGEGSGEAINEVWK